MGSSGNITRVGFVDHAACTAERRLYMQAVPAVLGKGIVAACNPTFNAFTSLNRSLLVSYLMRVDLTADLSTLANADAGGANKLRFGSGIVGPIEGDTAIVGHVPYVAEVVIKPTGFEVTNMPGVQASIAQASDSRQSVQLVLPTIERSPGALDISLAAVLIGPDLSRAAGNIGLTLSLLVKGVVTMSAARF